MHANLPSSSITPATPADLALLTQLEERAAPHAKQLARGLQAAHALGTCAAVIRRLRLYRARDVPDFRTYCRAAWAASHTAIGMYIAIAEAFAKEDLPEGHQLLKATWHAARAPLPARRALLDLVRGGEAREGDVRAGRLAALALCKRRKDVPDEAVAAAALGAATQRMARPPARRKAAPAHGAKETAEQLHDQLRGLRQTLALVLAQAAPLAPLLLQEAEALLAPLQKLCAGQGNPPERRAQPRAQPVVTAEKPSEAEVMPTITMVDGEADIAALCRDYEPLVVPPRPLAAPLPRNFADDPDYVVDDALLLGTADKSPQRGTLGRDFRDKHRVSLNLSEPFCLSAFGVPGSGKSYLCNLILQMAVQLLRYLNCLPRPACGLVLHPGDEAQPSPEILQCVEPNGDADEVRNLLGNYGARPEGMRDVLLLCPLAQVEAMRRRHPHCRVHPILFSLPELGVAGLKVLLGVRDGEGSLYMRLLGQILGRLGEGVTLDGLWRAVEEEPLLTTVQRRLIAARLSLVRPLLSDRWPLRRVLRPGRIVVVAVRDEWLPEGGAGVLAALCTSVLTRREAGPPLLVVFDEAHRLLKVPELCGEAKRLVRQRRHLDLGLLIASQDPLSVPREILALSDFLAIGKMASEEWVRHLVKANGNLRGLKVEHTARLRQGLLWLFAERAHAQRGLDLDGQGPALHLVSIRPQTAQHGGASRTAAVPQR